MHSETRTYRTGSDEVVLDLTRDAAEFVADRGDGLLQVFVPARDGRHRDHRDRRRVGRRPAGGAARPAARRRPVAPPPRLARATAART